MAGTQVEPGFVEPDYAGRSLGDVLPAVAAALGVDAGFHVERARAARRRRRTS